MKLIKFLPILSEPFLFKCSLLSFKSVIGLMFLCFIKSNLVSLHIFKFSLLTYALLFKCRSVGLYRYTDYAGFIFIFFAAPITDFAINLGCPSEPNLLILNCTYYHMILIFSLILGFI